jgi:hypothetical protein
LCGAVPGPHQRLALKVKGHNRAAEAKLIRQTRPRRTEQGDYEIRSVPSMLGEHSMSGGVMPKVGFEEDYEKADPSL